MTRLKISAWDSIRSTHAHWVAKVLDSACPQMP
jgi:hypothetical protein